MITTVDKAIVALLMASVFLINNLTSFHFALDENGANLIAGALTPLFVYLVPNKKA